MPQERADLCRILFGRTYQNKEIMKFEGIHSLSVTTKMPGYSWGISAKRCRVGSLLAKSPNTICSTCYALKGQYRYSTTENAQERRLEKYLENPEKWKEAMVAALSTKRVSKHGVFRWFDSGDLQSKEMLLDILEVCRNTPRLAHWIPTKEYKLIKDLDKNLIPENTIIRVSAAKIDGKPPSWWPTTSGVHKNMPPIGHPCPALKQGGTCGSCRACWNSSIKHVSYPHH